MKTSRREWHPFVAQTLLAVACAGTWVVGQVAVNSQRMGNAHSVNTAVNTQLHGPGPSGSVRYAQSKRYSEPMRSEWRHAYWKSGALPSDVRMGYAALGPMNPGGPMAYIPEKPSYLQKPKDQTPAPQKPNTYTGQSVRYASGGHNSSAMTSQGMTRTAPSSARVSSALSASGPINSTAASAGPIKYSR